ncbi:MAG TPA: outer membrane lipoprotein carrier protein LolA [Rhodospirillales bacterium]|nr:outer membrane lipoprotein carrier protein LolA [Rhodospirillales bacterium]
MPNRRTFLCRLSALAGLTLFPLAAPVRAALVPERQALLSDIESYLQGLRYLEARFSQIGPYGDLATGTFYLWRPGRLRIEYDPPSQVLLLATDWRLIFYDGSIDQVTTIPLAQTPLGFLLAADVDLEKEVEVRGLEASDREITVTVVRRQAPDQGSVTLVFARRPMELRRWTVIDPQGLATRVILEEIRTDAPIDPDLFRWRDPRIFGNAGD